MLGARWGTPRWLCAQLLAVTAQGAVAAHGAAPVPDPSRARPVARLSGVVHDSIAGAPLPGAFVQLVAVDSVDNFGRTERSDSLGRFAFTQLRAGRYVLGFFHPMLDSLGLEFRQRARAGRYVPRCRRRTDQ